jgi:hypothetical protein
MVIDAVLFKLNGYRTGDKKMKSTQIDQTSLRVSTFSYGTFFDCSCSSLWQGKE